MQLSRSKLILSLLAFALVGLYLGNASWLVSSNSGERLILAHRGLYQTYDSTGVERSDCTATRIHPPIHDYLENSLPSIQAALDLGADIVEIDIHPTTDNEFVVFHDWTLNCRTDGEGVVREHDTVYLKSLDIGFGYTADGGETFPFRGKYIGAMPTLNEVLSAFPEAHFLINLKGGKIEESRLLTDYLLAHNFQNQTRLSVSGNGENVPEYAELNPKNITLSRQRAIPCLKKYLLLGWSGYVPKECHNSYVPVPRNYRWLVWGWPNRFENRLRKVGSMSLLMGDHKKGAEGAGAINDLDSIPKNFGGVVWTNRVDIIGQKAGIDDLSK